jgi:hypothetical protein
MGLKGPWKLVKETETPVLDNDTSNGNPSNGTPNLNSASLTLDSGGNCGTVVLFVLAVAGVIQAMGTSDLLVVHRSSGSNRTLDVTVGGRRGEILPPGIKHEL